MSLQTLRRQREQRLHVAASRSDHQILLVEDGDAARHAFDGAEVAGHIQNLFEERELQREATVKESLIVQQEGSRSVQRAVDLYSIDVIISVGYRVKSHRGTQFRIWATQRLRESFRVFRPPLYASDTAPVDNSVGAGRRNRASQMQVSTNVTDTAPATG